MDNIEFVQQIEQWKKSAADMKVTLPNGKALPEKFWPVFLGYSESSYKKFRGTQADVRTIQAYTAKHIRLINQLPPALFKQELLTALAEFLDKFPQFRK